MDAYESKRQEIEDAKHEYYMRHNDDDPEYFYNHADESYGIIDALSALKKLCSDYGRSFDDELDIFKDMI